MISSEKTNYSNRKSTQKQQTDANTDNSIIVLLSGGMDSAACLYYYLSQGYDTRGLHVSYGQPPAPRELQSAQLIAASYEIQLDTLVIEFPWFLKDGEIRGRNALLILSAILFYPNHSGLIAMGIHSGTPYYDCSELFVKDINRILNSYTDGRVVLDSPFLRWNKKMIYQYSRENHVPLHLTYSCENSGDEPCCRCRSCLDRIALDAC
jgi:7-cyano-7-deazaguanine synthase